MWHWWNLVRTVVCVMFGVSVVCEVWPLNKAFPAVMICNIVLFGVLWGLSSWISLSFCEHFHAVFLFFFFLYLPAYFGETCTRHKDGICICCKAGTLYMESHSEPRSIGRGALKACLMAPSQEQLKLDTRRPGPMCPDTSRDALCSLWDAGPKTGTWPPSLKRCAGQMHLQRWSLPQEICDWRSLRKIGKGKKCSCLSTSEQPMQTKKPTSFHTKSDQILISLKKVELCQLTGTQTCLNWFEFSQLYNNQQAAEPAM